MRIVDESMLRGAASCARDGVDGRFRRGIRREVGRVRRLEPREKRSRQSVQALKLRSSAKEATERCRVKMKASDILLSGFFLQEKPLPRPYGHKARQRRMNNR